MEYIYAYLIGSFICALVNLQKNKYESTMKLANHLKKSDPKCNDKDMTHTAMFVGITIISLFWPIFIIFSMFKR